jgi:iron(III) transport system substrate-binding protein
VALALSLGWLLFRRGPEPLVVYCAHDSVYADAVLRRFTERTGIAVAARYDTEATKSLGFTELLLAERERPRCDVFWNNQVLGTLALRDAGLLAPYRGEGFRRIPETWKDPEGRWVGFGARLRVCIINTEKMAATEEAVRARMEGDLSRFAIAKPLYGTTFAHYVALWELWGEKRLREWHGELRKRGAREAAGNAQVKNLVAQGVCDFGWTDTDDFFEAKDAGSPVAMLSLRVDGGRALLIPNAVSILKNAPHPVAARTLVDYLLSEECELALAKSKARQIPLGPVAEEGLPPEVRAMLPERARGYAMGLQSGSQEACRAWLKSEYVK